MSLQTLIDRQRIIDTAASFNPDGLASLRDVFETRKKAAIMYNKSMIDSEQERASFDLICHCNAQIKAVIGL